MDNSPKCIHETVVRDILSILGDYAKNPEKLLVKFGSGDVNNRSYMRNIAKASRQLTLEFPVIVSDTVSVETAGMISKAIERKAVSMLQMLFSAISITNAKDAIGYLKQFHTNLDPGGNMGIDDFIDTMDQIATTTESASGIRIEDRAKFDAVLEDFRNFANYNSYLYDKVSDKSLNEYTVDLSHTGMNIQEGVFSAIGKFASKSTVPKGFMANIRPTLDSITKKGVMGNIKSVGTMVGGAAAGAVVGDAATQAVNSYMNKGQKPPTMNPAMNNHHESADVVNEGIIGNAVSAVGQHLANNKVSYGITAGLSAYAAYKANKARQKMMNQQQQYQQQQNAQPQHEDTIQEGIASAVGGVARSIGSGATEMARNAIHRGIGGNIAKVGLGVGGFLGSMHLYNSVDNHLQKAGITGDNGIIRKGTDFVARKAFGTNNNQQPNNNVRRESADGAYELYNSFYPNIYDEEADMILEEYNDIFSEADAPTTGGSSIGSTIGSILGRTAANVAGNIASNYASRYIDNKLNQNQPLDQNKDYTSSAKNMSDVYDKERQRYTDQNFATDIKKANEMVPSMMVIRFTHVNPDGTSVPIQQTAVIGVKAKLYYVTSNDMINRIITKNNDKNGLFNFIKATTSQISFWKDFVFAIDKAKLDAVSTSSRGQSNPIWKLLEHRAIKSKFRRWTGSMNDAAAISTLVISKEEADYIKKAEHMDVMRPSTVNAVMNAYNIMSFIVVDETLERADFLYDDGTNQYETISFSHLEREEGNGTYKKVINLLAKSK